MNRCPLPGCRAATRILTTGTVWEVWCSGDGVTWVPWDGERHPAPSDAEKAAATAMVQHRQHQHGGVFA